MIQTLIGDWDVIDDNQRDKRAAGDGGSGEEPCYGVNQYCGGEGRVGFIRPQIECLEDW